MSLSAVSAQLKNWADAAALKAVRANDPDTVHVMQQVADQYRTLLKTVQGAAVELQEAQRKLAEVTVPKPPRVLAMRRMSAFQFWHQRRLAVEAIGDVYGEYWAFKAPIGETVLATVPPCWRGATTNLGTKMKWNKDSRMPCARFWPDKKLPDGLEISPDYERHQFKARDDYAYTRARFSDIVRSRRRWYEPDSDGWRECTVECRERLDAFRKTTRTVQVEPVNRPHDAAWHRSRGYVFDHGQWRHEIEVRSALSRSEAIAAEIEVKRLASLECDECEDHRMAAE